MKILHGIGVGYHVDSQLANTKIEKKASDQFLIRPRSKEKYPTCE